MMRLVESVLVSGWGQLKKVGPGEACPKFYFLKVVAQMISYYKQLAK